MQPIFPAQTCKKGRMKKQNLKTFFISHSAFRISVGGFTLIEILVALIVVTVTVSVVLGSQLVSLKIEQKARALQSFRFEIQRICSITHRAENGPQLMELLSTGSLCRVKSEPAKIESGTNELFLIKHELSAEDLPAFSSVFYTRLPDYSGQRSEAGKPVKEQKSAAP